ncbi:hypothetical protein GW17_00001882 [Ensete ventricosum]|nr:hypothetical protein GW17_00001882 [Ensete ventricosum]RZR98702.1 hypothetical protein BHM03_00028115 [Ensete ventricosum]
MVANGGAPPRGSAAAAASMRRRRAAGGSAAAAGGGASTMLQFYTDDATGAKMSPNTVLFMSIGFIAVVALLHVVDIKMLHLSITLWTFHGVSANAIWRCSTALAYDSMWGFSIAEDVWRLKLGFRRNPQAFPGRTSSSSYCRRKRRRRGYAGGARRSGRSAKRRKR